ncbi:RNA ligase family protein [Streptomyces sp. NPDC047928]|uniref:RNA ligase family protein n=1 Tax=unclassified Streptomyces TaxID=2593676 RepID=UPI0037137352
MRTHYPRTPHLPWSPGVTADDVRVSGLAGFVGREVVVTEKLDGENTTLYADGLHARSLDSAHHPSRAWVKALQGRIGAGIPDGWRVCGENMYARHSLAYDSLDSHFYGFSVWDADGRCLGWDRTVAFLRGLGVPVPAVLWRGVFDERALRRLRLDTGRHEGYVVRTVAGFGAGEFRHRVAKWVRTGHVRTGTHWMHTAVVPNRLGPGAALWDVRSGGVPDPDALLTAVGMDVDPAAGERNGTAVREVGARLGGTGDARLAGVLAALLHLERRATLAGRLAPALGLPLARRVADLVGLQARLHLPYPDDARRAGLVRMSYAVDLGTLHTVAAAVAPDAHAREQVEWSALHAEDVKALAPPPLDGLGGDVAARCRGEAREAYARGRISTADEAVAATWRWRDGQFPRLVHLVGPSGSGKSSFAARLRSVDASVSLDDLREERGGRADQRGNNDVLRAALRRLDTALADPRGGTVVWDATSLNPHQRSLVHAVARRRDALVTHAVALVDEDELVRRNAVRPHPVPPEVLDAQLRRFVPPYPGQAHRTWYIGASGTVEEEA